MSDRPPDQPTPPPAAEPAPNPAQESAPESARKPDPGSRSAATAALIALIVLFVAVFTLQQQASGLPAEPVAETEASAPGIPTIDTTLRIALKLAAVEGAESVGPQLAGTIMVEGLPPGDDIRTALALHRLGDTESALTRLETLEGELEQRAGEDDINEEERAEIDAFSADLETAIAIIADGSDTLWPEQITRFVDRYAWHGELACATDPALIDDLLSGGTQLLFLFGGFGLLAILLLLAGIPLLLIAIIKLADNRLRVRLKPPAPGGSIYLETTAVFIAGFLFIQIVALAVNTALSAAGASDDLINAGTMATQWLLVLIPLYPVLRGVSWKQSSRQIGLHRGEGVVKELWYGFVGYVAGVPLFVLAAVIGALLTLVTGGGGGGAPGEEAPIPQNPIFDIITGSGPFELFAFATLAILWAPLIEEIVFRGALFRHMRSRIAWPLAALASAAVFAGMHGYGLAQLLPVFALGITFGAIRHWRGSLIGPIFAHLLHNGTLIGIMILALRVYAH